MKIELDTAVLPGLGPALVFEDNPLIAFDTQSMLEELGFAPVKILSSLAEGLEALAAQIYNFVVLDLKFGDDSSLELARVLMEKQTRFVFASGYAESEGLPLPFQGQAILSKPYTKDQLKQLIG